MVGDVRIDNCRHVDETLLTWKFSLYYTAFRLVKVACIRVADMEDHPFVKLFQHIMNQNQDKSDPNYLHDYHDLIVLVITSIFTAAMLSNPKVYAWSLIRDRSQELQSLEEDIRVVANELALEVISYCQSHEES
ncbi:MAG: hypothetical protein JO235_04555 [Chroococcidiopsidaceae cyanobacterium CP_BM_RX_35]|nr:hypothetical protein [Chroococcidiopsidaceae cyanobacterium CP_BM_RX_35]